MNNLEPIRRPINSTQTKMKCNRNWNRRGKRSKGVK